MVKTSLSARGAFTLIEVMVSVVLFMLVMLLLFRGVTAVTTTVSLGQRQSELHRRLKNIQRVMQDDVESLIVHPKWPVLVGEGVGDPPELMLAFLRYRNGVDGGTETEWVQYWREAHESEPRLERWVRYSAEATLRESATGQWWTSILREHLEGEVLADDVIAMNLSVFTDDGKSSAVVTHQVEAVDFRFFITLAPFPIVEDVADSSLQRMWDEEGSWMHFRVRPGFAMGPEVEETP